MFYLDSIYIIDTLLNYQCLDVFIAILEREQNNKIMVLLLEILHNLFSISWNNNDLKNIFINKNGRIYIERLQNSIDNEVCCLSEALINKYLK